MNACVQRNQSTKNEIAGSISRFYERVLLDSTLQLEMNVNQLAVRPLRLKLADNPAKLPLWAHVPFSSSQFTVSDDVCSKFLMMLTVT